MIIPHSLLHLVPFWAVPSLARFDTLIASSAAQLADSRRRGPGRLAGEALVVSNPTLDLPVSAVEARSAERHLATIGVRPNELAGLAAVERSAADGLARATALHFTGHGLSDFAEPIRSGLLLHPGEEWAATPDPFADLVTDDLVWEDEEEPTFDEERWADVPGVGRLYEIVDEERLERRLEREEGTLVAAYAGGTLLRVGELWSAGDLMLEQQADGCALAFLSACESGMAGGRRIDEYGGLPAALQLAGVRTLVSSLWPVSEALTAVYVELFYRELCDREGAVDVTAVVRRVRERLTEMSRDGVLELIASLRRSTDGVAARLTLDAFAAEIRQRGDSPFTDAWELAPFYVTGEGRVVLGGADADA